MTWLAVCCLLAVPLRNKEAVQCTVPLRNQREYGPGTPGWEDVSAGEGSQSAASAGGPLVPAEPKEQDVLRPRLEGEVRALTAHVVCRDGCLQLPRDLGCA